MVLGMPSPLSAEGFRNPFQSSSANGQGTAFSAQADDPSAIHYNPAGMTQLPGIQASFGAFLVSQTVNYTSPTGATAQGDLGGAIGLPPPGWLYVTANMGDAGIKSLDRLTFGVGLQSIFGFAIKFPENGPFASSVTKTTLPLLNIKPTVAYKITDHLSVGLGADIYTFASFLGEGQFERQFTTAGNKMELSGSGTTAGLNASLLFTPLRTTEGKPLLNLGFVWRSQAVLPIDGQLQSNGALVSQASTSLRFPETYTVALAGWPIRTAEREWKIEVDVDYARWQSVRSNDIRLGNGTLIQNPQKLMNTVNVAVGTEYKWLHLPGHADWELALRAGYLRSGYAFSNFSYDPAIPDGPYNAYTVGIGTLCHTSGSWLGLFACSGKYLKAIIFDLHYHYLLYEPRTIVGNANPTVDGTYKSTVHAGSFNIGFKF
jgi:long-chain fatty acid transport protein